MDALPSHEPHDQICDAAITVLATHGVSRLTAGAVDEQLGWSLGTTAQHYMTQRELLEAVAHRLVFLDALSLSSFRASAAGIAAAIERSFQPENHKRLLARLELYLYAARTPEFATMHWARDLFAAGAEAHMRLAGCADSTPGCNRRHRDDRGAVAPRFHRPAHDASRSCFDASPHAARLYE